MKRIGRYQLTQKLGEGGMGAVYEAVDPTLNRRVAIKLLPSHLLGNANIRSRFTQEAQTIAQLQHPNIVKILEYGEHTVDQLTVQPYFVMELMEGGSLAHRLQNGLPLPLAEVKRIIDTLAPAFDAAHNENIVHRDVKPGNILFDRRNIPYLSDFGIARLMTTAGDVTRAGTPAYMAPEQYTGKSGINRRTDIYQLGITIYQMLTGDVPFDTNTPERAMYNHINVPPPPIRQRNRIVPAQWESALSRALAKNPSERFHTVSALTTALALPNTPTTAIFDEEKIERQGSVITPLPPNSEQSNRRKQRSFKRIGIIMAVLTLVGLISFFALLPNLTQEGVLKNADTILEEKLTQQYEQAILVDSTITSLGDKLTQQAVPLADYQATITAESIRLADYNGIVEAQNEEQVLIEGTIVALSDQLTQQARPLADYNIEVTVESIIPTLSVITGTSSTSSITIIYPADEDVLIVDEEYFLDVVILDVGGVAQAWLAVDGIEINRFSINDFPEFNYTPRLILKEIGEYELTVGSENSNGFAIRPTSITVTVVE